MVWLPPFSLVAATSINSMPLPASVRDAVFVVAAVLCVIAQFFILRAVWRVVPSVTGSPSVPAPRRASEMAWAVLPALLIAGAFLGAWRLMHSPVISITLPLSS